MTEPVSDRLLDCVLNGSSRTRLSVIGLSKNAGKTETLNHMIRAADRRNLALGLVSTGRDGEDKDAITELPKPQIWVPTGAWVATVSQALAPGTAKLSGLRELPMNTPLGPVVVGQVERAGTVLLVGPGSARRVAQVLGTLEEQGALLSLVDGSFDRVAAAAPEITGRVVLAAGAAFSPNQEETLAQIRYLLDIFDLPEPPQALHGPIAEALAEGPVAVVTLAGTVIPLPNASPLSDPGPIVALAQEQADAGACLVLDGALSDRLLGQLVRKRAGTVAVVVGDPTQVLADRNLWRRWRRMGGRVYVRRPVRLVAVTTNPHAPLGDGYNAQDFLTSVQAVAFRPVFDLRAGLYAPAL